VRTVPVLTELAAWEARVEAGESLAPADARRLLSEVRRSRSRVGPPRILHTEGVCGGDTTVGQTRIRVWHVIALAPRYGWDPEALRVKEFSILAPEEVALAVQYHREHPEEIEAAFRREDETRAALRAVSTER
jgi:uncharacterized protein (DUF433 family)